MDGAVIDRCRQTEIGKGVEMVGGSEGHVPRWGDETNRGDGGGEGFKSMN